MHLTTQEVAKLFGVCQRTVTHWCDDGILNSYRIPGSRHRRITEGDLQVFADVFHLPLPSQLRGFYRISVGCDIARCIRFESCIEAALHVGNSVRRLTAFLDVRTGKEECLSFCRAMRRRIPRRCHIVAIGGDAAFSGLAKISAISC